METKSSSATSLHETGVSIRLLAFDWENGVLDRRTEELSEKPLLGYGEVVERAAEGFNDLTEVTSVFEDAAAVEVEVRPGAREGAFFMTGAVPFVGVGERSWRSAAGGVGCGDVNATFLWRSATSVGSPQVKFGSGRDDEGAVRLSNSVLLECGIGVWVGVGVEVGSDSVVEKSVESWKSGSSIAGSCLDDSSGSGLCELLELGRGCGGGGGGQSGKRPSDGIFSFSLAASLSFADPRVRLNLLRRKAFISRAQQLTRPQLLSLPVKCANEEKKGKGHRVW